jgi:hypothetical protein
MRKILMLLLGVFALCTQILAQNRTITGRVTDSQGNGLPNVSIQIKGTNTGTVSAMDGSYSLSVSPSATILVFSSVDRTSQEVAIGSRTTINATLAATNQSLQEVVVVGYGMKTLYLRDLLRECKGRSKNNDFFLKYFFFVTIPFITS